MKELTIRFKDVNELLIYFDKFKELIQEGYSTGTLLDGWDIVDLEQ